MHAPMPAKRGAVALEEEGGAAEMPAPVAAAEEPAASTPVPRSPVATPQRPVPESPGGKRKV